MSDCAYCHGAEGGGTTNGPSIRLAGTAAVDFMVRTGRMPLSSPDARPVRHTSRYSRAERDALVAYTASFVRGPEVPTVTSKDGDLQRGSKLYSENCATCHQAAGGGGALAFGHVAPPLRHADATEVVEAMRVGPGTMPIFNRESLNPAEATAIATYVQELRHPRDRGGASLGHLGPVPEGLVAWVVGLGSLLAIARLLGTRNRPQSAHRPGAGQSVQDDAGA